MVSLQVLTPHQKCIFNCLFCISKAHSHDNKFINNYDLDYELWKNNLVKVIKENKDLKYVVITGTNEPMQYRDCVKDIVNIVKDTNQNIQVEIQTHYYKPDKIYQMLDVTAYSIPNFNLLDKIKPNGKINRFVLILTDSFNNHNLFDIISLVPKNVTQITLKCLHDSNGFNTNFDEYIKKHKINSATLEVLRNDIKNYKGNLSIRLDEFCMDAEGRYKVFREDGNLYNDWDEE